MKRFGIARSVITAALISAAFAPAAQAVGTFSNMYTFGDSLSDIGAEAGMQEPGAPVFPVGNHWTYDGAPLWDQLLAAQYGLTLTPNNVNNPTLSTHGNAYAQGGAAAVGTGDTGISGIGDNVALQVASYLRQSGGKADANALYTVWIGGNDVQPALLAGQAVLASGGSATAAQAASLNYMNQAAQNAVAQVGALKAAGAQHIIVANLPNVGLTPELFNGVAGAAAQQLVTTQTAGAVASGVAAALGQGGNKLLIGLLTTQIQAATSSQAGLTQIAGAGIAAGQAQLNAATGPTSTLAYQSAGRATEGALASAYAQLATTAALNTLLAGGQITQAQASVLGSALPGSISAQLYGGLSGKVYQGWQTVSAAGTQLSSQVFNATESALLVNSGAIQVDIYKLMSEVFANPAKFGFDNVTGYACPAGTPADFCTSNTSITPGFDSSKRFFYADPFHPTPAATAAVEQYMYSILQAPYYAAQLVNTQTNAVYTTEGALDNRDMHARSVGRIDAIATFSGLNNQLTTGTNYLGSDNNNQALTVGADMQLASHYSLGVAASAIKSNVNFSNNAGKFSSSDYLMSFFNRYENGPWALNSDVFFGSSRYSNMHRNVTLAAYTRTENGSTSGSQAGLRFVGSYGFTMGTTTIAPTVSVAFREGKIGGYMETSADSTAATPSSTDMQYGQQRVDSLVFGGGVKVDGAMGVFKPYASLMYFNDAKDKTRTVSAGLLGSTSMFDTSVTNPEHAYTVFNVGTRFDLSKSVNAYIGYTYTGSHSDNKLDYYSLGMQAAF